MLSFVRCIALSAAVLTLTACTSKPIYAPTEQFPSDLHITPVQMQTAIVTGLQKRQWTVQVVTPSEIQASITVRGRHHAEVTIPYSTAQYRINYRDSWGLDYKDGKIHRNYNRWISMVNDNILRELHLDPIGEAINGLPVVAQTSDEVPLFLDFDRVVQRAVQAGHLDGSVRFFLAGERVPGLVNPMSETSTSKKTNSTNKTDEEACDWAMVSALATLQNAAKREGANAVVDIVSFYDRKIYSDAAKYECHTGALMAGVALRGKMAEIQ